MDHRIHQVHQQTLVKPQTKNINKETSPNFKDILTSFKDIKLSKHAKQRLQERNIHINSEQWQIIGKKIEEAKQKGITDSLVVMDKAALLISGKNNTVVTAMDKEEATNKIFTNINGTILIND